MSKSSDSAVELFHINCHFVLHGIVFILYKYKILEQY